MKRPHYELYRDASVHRDWRWRLRAANGRIVADSGEGYTSRRAAVNAYNRLARVAGEAMSEPVR